MLAEIWSVATPLAFQHLNEGQSMVAGLSASTRKGCLVQGQHQPQPKLSLAVLPVNATNQIYNSAHQECQEASGVPSCGR